MFTALLRARYHALLYRSMRGYATGANTADIRTQLTSELKNAMKTKDTQSSTTIRSVLSDVYAADKASSGSKIEESAIVLLIRKAVARRADSAAQFMQASRPDLAEKEQQEMGILSKFLPPLMSEAELDGIVKDIVATEELAKPGSDPRKAMGKVFKLFFARVDRSIVDQDMLKRRVEAALTS